MDKKSIENFKTIAIILLVLYIVLGTNLFSSSNESHRAEYSDAQAEESSYWFNMGYEHGYSEAKHDAEGDIEAAKMSSSDYAYEAGYEKGYWDGYSDCEKENGLAETGSYQSTKKITD